ncbi:MAG: hypothetical protein ACOYKZ_03480 [Chlamydiia bacterium]
MRTGFHPLPFCSPTPGFHDDLDSSTPLDRDEVSRESRAREIRLFAQSWRETSGQANLKEWLVNWVGPFLDRQALQDIGRALFGRRDNWTAHTRESIPNQLRSNWFACLNQIFAQRMVLPQASGIDPNPHPALTYAYTILHPSAERTQASASTNPAETPQRATSSPEEPLPHAEILSPHIEVVQRVHRLAEVYSCGFLRRATYWTDTCRLGGEVWNGLMCRRVAPLQVTPDSASAERMPTLSEEVAAILVPDSTSPFIPLPSLAQRLLTLGQHSCPDMPQRPPEQLNPSQVPVDFLLDMLNQEDPRKLRNSQRVRSDEEQWFSIIKSLLVQPSSLLACIGQNDPLCQPGRLGRVLNALLLQPWFQEELGNKCVAETKELDRDYLRARLDELSPFDMQPTPPYLVEIRTDAAASGCKDLAILLVGNDPEDRLTIYLTKLYRKGVPGLLREWFNNSTLWQTLRRHLQREHESRVALQGILRVDGVMETLLREAQSEDLPTRPLLQQLLDVAAQPAEDDRLQSFQSEALLLNDPPVLRALIEHPDHWEHFLTHVNSIMFIRLLCNAPALLDICLEDPRAWELVAKYAADLDAMDEEDDERPVSNPKLIGLILSTPGLIPKLLNDVLEHLPVAELITPPDGHFSVCKALEAPGLLDRIGRFPRHQGQPVDWVGGDARNAPWRDHEILQGELWQELLGIGYFQAHALHIPGVVDHWERDSELWKLIDTMQPSSQRQMDCYLQILSPPHVQALLDQPLKQDIWYQCLCRLERTDQLGPITDAVQFAELVAHPIHWDYLWKKRVYCR